MNQPAIPIISTTNFDLPSVHLLLPEIDVILKDTENCLSEFYEDGDNMALLEESAQVVHQLASVFDLIDFKGASELSLAIAKSLDQLRQGHDSSDNAFMMDISEGVMTLERYIEFVLLKEMLEPSLLLPIINKLRAHLGEASIDRDALFSPNSSISIANPQQHYQSLASLGLEAQSLVVAYRAGLGILLAKRDGNLSDEERGILQAMSAACARIAEKSDTLFWQSAAIVTNNIADDVPLSNAKKRMLIYLEQQFQDYLPIHDRRFADLVGFACGKNGEFARLAQQKYGLNQFSEDEQRALQRFLFGPDCEIADTLNALIQEEILDIKHKVDALVRDDSSAANVVDLPSIAEQIHTLSQSLQLLNLNEAAGALAATAEEIKAWQTPTPEDFDKLLADLMVAENAAIFLAKTHTPGAVKLPLHNRNISLHQLDTANETLIKEGRVNLATISQAILDYSNDTSRDPLHLQNVPEALTQVAGAADFLNLASTARMLKTLARHLHARIDAGLVGLNDEALADIADVVVAADYQFEAQEDNRPVNKQMLLIGKHSLNHLINA